MQHKYLRQHIPGPCTLYALVHALGLLGIFITLRQAHRMTGVSLYSAIRSGTDTKHILRALRKCGLKPRLVCTRNEGAAQRKIDRFLSRG